MKMKIHRRALAAKAAREGERRARRREKIASSKMPRAAHERVRNPESHTATCRAIINGLTLPRFYPVLDTAALRTCGIAPPDAARAVIEAGARILQLRHKDHYARRAFAEAEDIARLCRDAGVLLVLNDRADIALLLGAALHLGQEDLPPAAARAITGAETCIGFSTHNEDQLRAAAREPVDYIALGPVFGTASKQNPDPVVGLNELRRLRPLTTRPLVAIGGITRNNALQTIDAGADSLAVIGDLLADVGTPQQLRKRTEEWLLLTSRPKP